MDDHKESVNSSEDQNSIEMCLPHEENQLEIAVDNLPCESKETNNSPLREEDEWNFVNEEKSNKDNVSLKRIRKLSRKKVESLQDGSQIYQCVECSATFSRLSQLKAHAKSHMKDKPGVSFFS